MNISTIYDDVLVGIQGYYRVSGQVEIMFRVVCILSAICSFSVMLTPVLFPSMMRKKIFMQVIFFCSFSDCVASFIMSFGFPSGTLCVVQGALSYYFYRASWIWVFLLTLQLYSVVINGRLKLTIYHLHFIAWGGSLVFELIPLSTNAYGMDDGGEGYQPCTLIYGANPQMGEKWIIATFVAPLILCLVLMLILTARLWLRYRTKELLKTPIVASIRILTYYPASMILFWLPYIPVSVMLNIQYFRPKTADWIALYVTLAWGSGYGVILALIFFSNSEEARKRWHYLLFKGEYENQTIPIDFQENEEVETLLQESYAGGGGRDVSSFDSDSRVSAAGSSRNSQQSRYSSNKSLSGDGRNSAVEIGIRLSGLEQERGQDLQHEESTPTHTHTPSSTSSSTSNILLLNQTRLLHLSDYP